MATTLTVEEILRDVIDAFKIQFPIIQKMSTDFRPTSLKLEKTYDAHIVSLPSISEYDADNGGYRANATNVRDLIEDVPVTVDQHPKVSLKATHLNAIKDDKQEYDKVIAGAGFVIGKNMMTNIVSKFNARTISQSSTFSTANSDYDAIENIRDDMNLIGAHPMGRNGIVNTAVAGSLQLDSRVLSSDYRGEMNGANAYRRFQNISGFEEVMEWPELPSNNGSAVTVSGIEADDEVVTCAAAHGLLVGDRVVFAGLTSGTGLTNGTIYHVVSVPTATTLTVSATAGGSAVNISVDYDGGTIARVENLTGMFFEPRAISLLSGIPDDFDEAARMFGAPPTYGLTVVQDDESGLTLASIAEEAGDGTLNGYLHLTHVFGVSVGKQVATASAGDLCDYAGHRLISA